MKEKHIAYKIARDSKGLVCTESQFEEDKMLNVLQEIQAAHTKGIYWIFKQLNGKPQEAVSIIDCEYNRIYYHYSGEVENLDQALKKLSQLKG